MSCTVHALQFLVVNTGQLGTLFFSLSDHDCIVRLCLLYYVTAAVTIVGNNSHVMDW